MLRFIDESPSPFHAVATAERHLSARGYQLLDEGDSWSLKAEGRYLVKRGGSLIALQLGGEAPAESGFRLVGAHTDSPNLRLKPKLAKAAHGQLLFDIEPYGGLLIATWSDRDLAVAGRVLIRGAEGLEERLVRSDAVCRVANLAIHLNRSVNDEGLRLNKHKHLAPLLGAWDGKRSPEEIARSWLAELSGCAPEEIVGHDLSLFDIQTGAFTGLRGEYLQTGRLDNLASSYHGLSALLEVSEEPAPFTRVLCLFDHEEVGSRSARGADGDLLASVLRRVAGDGVEALPRAIERSWQVSADMAHALHPNYADRHAKEHAPEMNKGPVIKHNVNTRYATDGETSARFRMICDTLSVPVQDFVNRPDLACGSTIGSITAAQLGLRTVDVGNPMWSMHSAREMAGTEDQVLMHRVLAGFYRGLA